MDLKARDFDVMLARFTTTCVAFRERFDQMETDNVDLQKENRELREQVDYWKNKGMGGLN